MASYTLVRPISHRIDREHFLQGVGGAVSFQRPHFHLTKTLAAELCLAAQRLLGYQVVWPEQRAWILSSTKRCSLSM